MAYVVEYISREDKAKVLSDIAHSPQLSHRFRTWGDFSDPQDRLKWAIDRNSGAFLFRSPSFVREIENEFHFFSRGVWYVVAVTDSGFKNKKTVVYSYTYGDIVNVSEEFRLELTQAFSVYGMYGRGGHRSTGEYDPSCEVIPMFGAEA